VKIAQTTVVAALAAACLGTSAANAAQVLLLNDIGFGSTLTYYQNTFAGQTTGVLNHNFTAATLSGASLVISNGATSFSQTELAALTSYVNGGGRLLLGTEGSIYSTSINTANLAYAALGSSIRNDLNAYDAGNHTTTNIVSSLFAAGVQTISYAYASGLSGGTALVFGASGETLVAYQQIGAGYVFGLTDSNLTDQYVTKPNDNAQLFRDIETGGLPGQTPLPAAFPLFATGAGFLGLIGWRKKRKACRLR
jgi:hypothetical protein